jgi:hypothetical protein
MTILNERRRFGRRATTIHAFIDVSGRPGVACVIRNLSEGGALIELFQTTELPPAVGLRLPNTKIMIDCEIVRSTGNKLGIKFKPQHGSIGAEARRALKTAGDALNA